MAHGGRVANSGPAWTFRGERTRTIDNPLHRRVRIYLSELRGGQGRAGVDPD